MLLVIEVSLYCPRFAVMDIVDGCPRLVYSTCNDRHQEAGRTYCRRTPPGVILQEIACKLDFILTAYPINHAVITKRRSKGSNYDATLLANGAILLTLCQFGITTPDELQRSKIVFLLTGRSKAPASVVHKAAEAFFPELSKCGFPNTTSIYAGLAWYHSHQFLTDAQRGCAK